MMNGTTVCVYHSREWDALVEAGWVTMHVRTNVDGDQIATMALCHRRS